MKFLGMGWPELIVILIVILIIFGPKNLPKLGNAIGKTVSNLRSGMKDGKKEKAVEGGETDGPDAADAAPTEVKGEIEGVVEDAPEGVDAVESPEAREDDLETEAEEGVVSADAEIAVGEGEQAPKKVVRRVVKKKVAEDPAE